MINNNTIKKFFKLISSTHGNKYLYFIFLYFFNLILELLGIGLIVPFLQVIVSKDFYLEIINYLKIFDFSSLSKSEFLLVFIAFLLSVYTFKALFLTYISYINQKFLIEVKLNLSKKLFSSYLNQPYNFHIENNSSKLSSHINDVNSFVAVTNSGIILINESLIFFGLFFFLFIFNPILTLTALIFFGFSGIFFYRNVQAKSKIWGSVKQKNNILIFNQIKQSFGAIKELIILGRINYSINKFFNYSRNSAEADFKQGFVISLPRIWLELFGIIGINIILIFIIYTNQDISIFISTVGLFVVILYRLMPSITRIMNAIQQIKFFKPIIDNIHDQMFTDKNFINDKIDVNKRIIFNTNIKIKNICYSYKKNKNLIFNNLNFNINKNSFIGISGKSGLGKTTLINIILGIINPDKGTIEVDGVDIKNNLKSWRSIIGYVPQDIYLNDDLLYRNIAFEIPEQEINFDLINEVIALSQLSKFVEMLPKGINTEVGELGDKISGGQRQRIGIARALYNQPELIIFDEATNALDPKTEESIIKEISLLKNKKTIIFVSHRVETLQKYAEIYELSNNFLVKKN
jgi:ABC-type bacteriocin/lantibiotic exporter with double-glycine peptidase domain